MDIESLDAPKMRRCRCSDFIPLHALGENRPSLLLHWSGAFGLTQGRFGEAVQGIRGLFDNVLVMLESFFGDPRRWFSGIFDGTRGALDGKFEATKLTLTASTKPSTRQGALYGFCTELVSTGRLEAVSSVLGSLDLPCEALYLLS
jgi:hypothetical protein